MLKIVMFKSYILIFIFIFSSCTITRYVTETERSGVEQLLISKSIDRAIEKINEFPVKNIKIYIDIASLAPKEEIYLKKALSHWFLKKGAIIVENKKEADLIASILVKCIGTDRLEATFGVPSLPIPFTGIMTPHVDILAMDKQKGYSEIEIVFYSTKSGNFRKKTDSLVGQANFNVFKIFLIPIYRNNIYD
ncbi:MAG: hypothetical protein LWW95_00250 [Candidatus Desulfofervidus auxilii]|nr:hypothetical protein [Candidatus Desulfofervidus auxilii]